MDGKVDALNAPTETPTSDTFTAELDDDGGPTDTTIEITLAFKESRVGEECLWLITHYQTALDFLTAKKNLPKQSVRFTLCEVSAADVGVTKTDLHSWRDVITTLLLMCDIRSRRKLWVLLWRYQSRRRYVDRCVFYSFSPKDVGDT